MPSLFEQLPFNEAIDALRERLATPKPVFLELSAANRSRAFTMAWVSDQHVLENIHDELSQAINDGETYADFERRLMGNVGESDGASVRERTGWTGTALWHHRLVYEQNLSMAYAAGRVQQGTENGMQVWRYLPSLSDNPRPEHEEYYNQLYRFEPGSPVPPIDFNCGCGWEWVFPEELEAMGIDPADLPVFDPPEPESGFVWSPADYFDLQATVSGHSELGKVYAIARGECYLIAAAAVERVSSELRDWVEWASQAAEKITAEKLDRLTMWMQYQEGRLGMAGLRDAIADPNLRLGMHAMAALQDDDEIELNHQATLAALLAGMAAVAGREKRLRSKS